MISNNSISEETRIQITSLIESNDFAGALKLLSVQETFQAIAHNFESRLSTIAEKERQFIITQEQGGVAYARLAKDILNLCSDDAIEPDFTISASFIPLLPLNYIQPSSFDDIENLILRSNDRYYGITGMPGSGKTVFAAALAQSKKIQLAFNRAIFWVGMNKSSAHAFNENTPIPYQQQLYTQLQNEQAKLPKINIWQEQLPILQKIAKQKLGDEKCLIVIDHPPGNDCLIAALEIHEKASYLIVSDDLSLLRAKGIRQEAILKLEGLSEEKALQLLSSWTGIPLQSIPKTAKEIVLKLGYLPLAIAMTGAVISASVDKDQAWQDILDAINEGDLSDISHPVDKYQLRNLGKVFNVVLGRLDQPELDRLYDLSVFPHRFLFEIEFFLQIWHEEKDRKIRLFIQNLVDKALLQPIGSTYYFLHNLLRLHIRGQLKDVFERYERIGSRLFPSIPIVFLATNWEDETAITSMACRINIDEENVKGATSLHLASEKGYRNVVRELLKAGADINKKFGDNISPLVLASQNGHAAVAGDLIMWGAQVNEQGGDLGFAPLHWAAQFGRTEVVKTLLNNGATANLPNNYRKSPLYIAAYHGQEEVVRELLTFLPQLPVHETDPKERPLRFAIKKGNQNVVNILLKAGADVHWASPQDGTTALHLAAEKGQDKIVKTLLENNAPIEARSSDGLTPLHISSQNGHDKVIEILIAAGASVDVTDNRGFTALFYAAGSNQECVSLLIKAGANVNHVSIEGYTALYIAFQLRNSIILSSMQQASSFSMTETGTKAISVTVAEFKKPIIIELLLHNGASPYFTMEQGNTFLHIAAATGDPETVKLLIAAGHSKVLANNEGKTPLDLAREWLAISKKKKAINNLHEIIKILSTT